MWKRLLAWLLAVELRKHVCIPFLSHFVFPTKGVGQQMTILGKLLALKI